MKHKKAFTLIELLIVIAIIGILAGILFVSIGQTPLKKSRDAKRRADFKNLQTALTLYYSDNNTYPSTANAWWANCPDFGSHGTSGATGWIPNLAPTYVPSLPLDPKYFSTYGCYLYNSDGIDYKLLAHQTLEIVGNSDCGPGNLPPSSDPMYDPIRSINQCSIAIFTPGFVSR